MALIGYTRFVNKPVYKTTFIVPVDDVHHAHFSLGKRVEGGIRDIATDAHPIDECKNPNWFIGDVFAKDKFLNVVMMGCPIDQVPDWTDEEAEILALALCPQTRERYEYLKFRLERDEILCTELIRETRPINPSGTNPSGTNPGGTKPGGTKRGRGR